MDIVVLPSWSHHWFVILVVLIVLVNPHYPAKRWTTTWEWVVGYNLKILLEIEPPIFDVFKSVLCGGSIATKPLRVEAVELVVKHLFITSEPAILAGFAPNDVE
jgi:hypothetical protein